MKVNHPKPKPVFKTVAELEECRKKFVAEMLPKMKKHDEARLNAKRSARDVLLRVCARIGDRRSDGHLPWTSRDIIEIDCRATGCALNVNGQCAVPTQCEITEQGSCKGFKARVTPRIEGD